MGVYEDGREAAVASATASAPPPDRSALDWLLEPALEPAGLTETFTSSPATLRERRSSRDAYEFDLVVILSSIWPMSTRPRGRFGLFGRATHSADSE